MAIYQKEYEERLEFEAKEREFSAWLHGAYIVNAVQAALNPKEAPYPNNPFMNDDSKDEHEDSEISAIKFAEYAEAFNKSRAKR